MSEMPEYRPETEDACPACRGIGRIGEARACPTCDGRGSCPHRPLDQAWMRAIQAIMSGDLYGAYAVLDQIRDGSFVRPHGRPDMENEAPCDMPHEQPELDPAAVLEAVESLLRDNTSQDI